jgi:hypothetical protein
VAQPTYVTVFGADHADAPPGPGHTAGTDPPLDPLTCARPALSAASISYVLKRNLWPDKLADVERGVQLERDWRLDDARQAYAKALDTKSAAVAACAVESHRRVAAEQAGVLWRARWITPIRWINEDGGGGIRYGLILGIASLLALAGALALIVVWFVHMRQTFRIAAPTCVAGDLPVGLFAAELGRTMASAAGLLQGSLGGNQISGGVALTLDSSELGKNTLDALPKVHGIELGSWVALLQMLARFPSRRLDCQIAHCGPDILCYAAIAQFLRAPIRTTVRLRCAAPAAVPSPSHPRELILAARRVAYWAAATIADPALRRAY